MCLKMNNQDKRELSLIVRSISKDEIKNNSIANLWRKYANDFEYATFRKYLRACQR